MGPENRAKYSKLVDAELEREQESLRSIEYGRNTAESAMTSHHDHLRFDLAIDASIVMGLIDTLMKFKGLVDNAEPCVQIQEGALFRANLIEEGEILEAIYSPVKIVIEGITTITPNSPLGQAIKGLKVGDAFFYGPDKAKQMVGFVDNIE